MLGMRSTGLPAAPKSHLVEVPYPKVEETSSRLVIAQPFGSSYPGILAGNTGGLYFFENVNLMPTTPDSHSAALEDPRGTRRPETAASRRLRRSADERRRTCLRF